ncbi:hypothetical protein N0V88_000711 [Collariella sp. IMI 366227]|nr:hypothetical protein N0V88_000711 [Collariella sp. IMI 366227]
MHPDNGPNSLKRGWKPRKTNHNNKTLVAHVAQMRNTALVKKKDITPSLQTVCKLNLVLYIVAAPTETLIDRVHRQLANVYDVKALGEVRRFLGYDVVRNWEEGTIFVSQESADALADEV